MNSQRCLDVPISGEKETSEVVLRRFDHYIVTCTRNFVRYSPPMINMAVVDLEIDELIQRVRIKFWYALERGSISYPNAYIKCIIHSEIIDLKRRQKRFVSLFSYEDQQGLLPIEQVGLVAHEIDPADAIERRMNYFRCLKNLVQAVSKLPPRQRHAMICSLKDRVDDEIQLTNSFKEHKIDIEEFRWPIEKAEKQRMQASLSPARRSLAKHLSSQTSRNC